MNQFENRFATALTKDCPNEISAGLELYRSNKDLTSLLKEALFDAIDSYLLLHFKFKMIQT